MYMIKAINNKIAWNKAGIAGGGIYSPKSVNKSLFDLSQCEIYNNTVNSYWDNYTSAPSYIVLNTKIENYIKIYSGDYLPLSFTLYDEYDKIIEDITKYNSITLKITLQRTENDIEESNDKILLYGNSEIFVNGRNIYIYFICLLVS